MTLQYIRYPSSTFTGSVTLYYPSTPTVYNMTMASAATEYSFSFPANVRQFTIRCRTPASLKLSYVPGGSSTTYFTLQPGTVYSEVGINSPSLTIYVQCEIASNIIEIITWI